MERSNLTRLIVEARDEPERLANTVVPLVYEQLRSLAQRRLSRLSGPQTLNPTALVNEVYLRLVDAPRLNLKDRAHFFALAAQAIRQILVAAERKKRTLKRGGAGHRVTLVDPADPVVERGSELLAIDEALERLARCDERQARVVELRFFAGLTEDEIALELGVSERTVRSDWHVARAWLNRELAKDS